MNYPAALIPRSHFKRIDTILEKCWLCRTTLHRALLEGYNGRLREEAFCNKWEEFYDYSTNLLGHFRLEDNFLSLCGEGVKYFRSYWDFQEEVRIPVFEHDFFLEPDKGIFFLPLAAIHRNIRIPFNRPPKNTGDVLTAIVLHTPTHANFWHFSIRWEDNQKMIIKPNDSRWKEEQVATMRAFLMELLEMNPPEFMLLPDECYCKNE